jgi:hypothetical protein
MQAGHEGAGPERSFGANIRLPWEQAANPIIDKDEKLIHFKYFFTRKLTFVRHSDALALFPGGFGTLDEGYEALTLMQTGKGQLVPLVLLTGRAAIIGRHGTKVCVNNFWERNSFRPTTCNCTRSPVPPVTRCASSRGSIATTIPAASSKTSW